MGLYRTYAIQLWAYGGAYKSPSSQSAPARFMCKSCQVWRVLSLCSEKVEEELSSDFHCGKRKDGREAIAKDREMSVVHSISISATSFLCDLGQVINFLEPYFPHL